MNLKSARVLVQGAAIFTLAAGAAPFAGAAQADTPTFSKDVSPILYDNCVTCHRPGEVAPMSLITYKDARPWSRAIKEKVLTGEMPPWHADPAYGRFLNDRRLSEAEKETIVQWVDAGAPEGDPGDLPLAPEFAEGWTIGNPDIVISMAKPYEVPAEGEIKYQYFPTPTGFTEDKWVQAIELRPGARSVVHHILLFAREPGDRRPAAFRQVALGGSSEGSETREPALESGGATGNLIATTAPGTNALIFQPGMAMRIKAGSTLVFQVHYTSNGAPATDVSSVGMVFAKEPPAKEIRAGQFINARFVLPPGASRERVDSEIVFTDDARIWALFPHTHLRGKSWEYRLVYPDGRSVVVLSVPNYDFSWQTYYEFAEPLVVPRGTRLQASAYYDNSAANRANPDPTAAVRWGDQTWEEMQYSGIAYSVDGLADVSAQGR